MKAIGRAGWIVLSLEMRTLDEWTHAIMQSWLEEVAVRLEKRIYDSDLIGLLGGPSG